MKKIETVPNQKKIIIDKPKMPTKEECIKYKINFAYFDSKALQQACSILNGTEFKLWVSLMGQAPQIEWTLSPSAMRKYYGIPEASYHRAISGLRKKGYLDDNAIHMSIKMIESQNETDADKMIDDESQNETDNDKMIVDESQNDDRNSINNSISNSISNNINNNDNNFVITSDDKVEQQPKEELPIVNASELDFAYRYTFHDEWRDKVENDILVLPNGNRVKVRYKVL